MNTLTVLEKLLKYDVAYAYSIYSKMNHWFMYMQFCCRLLEDKRVSFTLCFSLHNS